MSRGVRVLRICGGGGGGGRQGWVVKHSLVHCMTVSGFPGLLLDASSILPLSPPHTHTHSCGLKNVSIHCHVAPGGQDHRQLRTSGTV